MSALREDIHIALICQSNVNRSMEAHAMLQKHGYKAYSYGAGKHYFFSSLFISFFPSCSFYTTKPFTVFNQVFYLNVISLEIIYVSCLRI